jgi:hypothetical protein
MSLAGPGDDTKEKIADEGKEVGEVVWGQG